METTRDVEKGRRYERVMKGVTLIKVHCVHMWKCQSETSYFVLLIYVNKMERHKICSLFLILVNVR
jgi:hypothetical protein